MVFFTNAQYQKLNNNGKTVATDELRELVEKNLFETVGSAGRGRKYTLAE